ERFLGIASLASSTLTIPVRRWGGARRSGCDGKGQARREGLVTERGERPVAIFPVFVTVGEGRAAGTDHASARPAENMVACGRIPFHGWAAAHIDIGLPGGD